MLRARVGDWNGEVFVRLWVEAVVAGVMDTNPQKRGVLFIGHTAMRHGAPMELLHFLRWYREHGDRRFSLLLDGGGELFEEYRQVCDVWAASGSHWCPGGIRSKVLTRAGVERWALAAEAKDIRRFAEGCSPELIYVNSVAADTARLLQFFDAKIPVLLHVHELEYLLRLRGSEVVRRLFSRTTRFVGCSGAVSQNLIDNHGIDPDRVDTVHESIPVSSVEARSSRDEILERLGFDRGCLLVTACGLVHWNKGTDLFVQLARMVCQHRGDICFAWIGRITPLDREQFEYDLRKFGIGDKVRFAGAMPNSADYLAASDVFVLTSREDSFPLVCLEAASLAKPILCFADSGGMPEFVENDCGFVAPYADVRAMGERILILLGSPDCRRRMGETARRKVRERHDVAVAAPLIMEAIERTVACG